MPETAVNKTRTLSAIAREIAKDWAKPYFGAVPYLDAMKGMGTWEDGYECDTSDSIVAYFLSNATTWNGRDDETGEAAELKGMLKAKRGK